MYILAVPRLPNGDVPSVSTRPAMTSLASTAEARNALCKEQAFSSPSCGLPASEPTSYCNGARKCVHSFSASPFNAYQGLRVVRRSAYLFSQFPFFTVLYVSSNVNPLQYLRNILSKHMSYLDYHVGYSKLEITRGHASERRRATDPGSNQRMSPGNSHHIDRRSYHVILSLLESLGR
jgi:hypothetical protein